MKSSFQRLPMTALLFFIGASFLSSGCREQGQKQQAVLSDLTVVPVGPADFSSSFSYYNTTPESPDGNLIAYVKYLSVPKEERYEKVSGEIWICDRDLDNHRKVVDISMFGVHNGARLQWLDNRSFVYQDDSIRAISIEGVELIKAVAGTVGHNPFQGRFLFSAVSAETGLFTIFEYDVSGQEMIKIGDVSDYTEVEDLFSTTNLRPLKDRKILHLQYSPGGERIAFRLDIGSKDERDKILITQQLDGSDTQFFGPKPMHFSWFDDETIVGHDNQIEDGMPDNKSGRRWDLNGNFVETVSGVGNHLAVSNNRRLFAAESWYKQDPIILRVFRKGETVTFWEDTVSTDPRTTWTLGNHVNPSFSRDDKRLYFNKRTEDGKVKACMVTLPE